MLMNLIQSFETMQAIFLNVNDLFTIELVSKIICELKTGRAPGLDWFDNGLHLSQLSSIVSAPTNNIIYVYIYILVSGHVPAQYHGMDITYIRYEKGRLGIHKLYTYRGYTEE